MIRPKRQPSRSRRQDNWDAAATSRSTAQTTMTTLLAARCKTFLRTVSASFRSPPTGSLRRLAVRPPPRSTSSQRAGQTTFMARVRFSSATALCRPSCQRLIGISADPRLIASNMLLQSADPSSATGRGSLARLNIVIRTASYWSEFVI